MDLVNDKFDFDHWLELANTDLSAFEALRRSVIEELIEQAPEEQRDRLRRLQWRIDQERRLSKSPMGACIRISRMMWEQVIGEGGLIDRLQQLNGRSFSTAAHGRSPAKVIPLVRGRGV